MSNPSLEDRCIVNACFDNKLLNDFDMICKILKKAMQMEFDKKLILPKLEEILTSGRYLWNKSSEMGRVGQGKRELNKDCFLNEKDKSYGVREEKEVINDLDKQKEIEDNDTDLIEDKSPTTPMTFNTQEIEADSDFIGNSGTIVKDARKYKNVKMKSYQGESNSKNTKWIKCEILNCSGGIDKAFEENANDINHLDGVSSLTSKSKESGKWKCNSNKQVLSSNEFEKVNDKSEKESAVKFRWTVNRNMRMHRFHRKCLTQPRDLDSDNYSEIEQGYFCRDCLFIFRRKNKYLLHKRLKGGHCLRDCIYCDADEQKEVYSCTKCPKCFQTKEMLERHNEKHKHLFGCDFCISEFYTVNDLKIHVQTVHAETALPTYLCDLCGSKFKERKVLNAHRRFVHSNHRPEACTSCDKRFKTKSQLKNHLVTHKQASELNLSCEICGKMFLRVATLKDHVRRHKKEFTCFCTICNKGFYRKYSLAEHMRVHTGDKPFDCKFCGFKCALSCNLVKHMKVHF